LNLEVDRPDWSSASSSTKVLPFEAFIDRQTIGIVTASFPQHVMGFSSRFPYFEIEFSINSLFFHRCHTKCDKPTPQSLTWL
jgi:hypothetical protein